MSGVDVAETLAFHAGEHECLRGWVWDQDWPCQVYQLAQALERAQAASAGVDMLVAQAERRGAVKALRTTIEVFRTDGGIYSEPEAVYCEERIAEIESGASL